MSILFLFLRFPYWFLELFLWRCIFCFVFILLCNVWNFRATSKFLDSSFCAVWKLRAPEILLSYEGNEGISGYFGLKYGKK